MLFSKNQIKMRSIKDFVMKTSELDVIKNA